MRPGDLGAAAALANAVHLSYPEDASVIADRFRLYPNGCFVLDDGVALNGHLVSHPWVRRSLPALNTTLGSLPATADCYYLHDLTLLEPVRGLGHALSAIDLVIEETRACGLDTILLVAVGDAHGYWERVGFEPWFPHWPGPTKGYGQEARAYIRRL